MGCDGDSFVGRFIITRKAGLFGELVAFSASWSSRSWDYVDAFWVEGELWYCQIRELRISLSLLLDTWLLTDLQWNFRCLWAYLYHSTFKSLVNSNTNNSIQVETHAMLFLLCQSDVVTMNNPKGHFYFFTAWSTTKAKQNIPCIDLHHHTPISPFTCLLIGATRSTIAQ